MSEVVAITVGSHRIQASDDESWMTNDGLVTSVSLALRADLSVSIMGRQTSVQPALHTASRQWSYW